jgi:F-type H+-transporting ATPase subunit b
MMIFSTTIFRTTMFRQSLMLRSLRSIFLLALAVCITPSAFAAGGGGHENATFLGLPTWVWLTANLIIFWGAIFKFGGPPISRFLEQRAEKISEDLALAKQQRREAEEANATLQQRIAELETEMEEIVSHSERLAEHEKDAILEQAEQDKERILSQARDEIRNRVGLAKQELQHFAAELATDLAAQKLKSQVGSSDQDRLFDEALERLRKEATN